MQKSRLSIALAAAAALFAARHAGAIPTVYSNQIPTVDTNPNPNFGVSGDLSVSGPNGVIFDDVQIDTLGNPLNQNFISLTGATVGILREPGAPAVTVTAYAASTTTPANPNDFPILNDNSVTAFGSFPLPAFTGATEAVVPVNISPVNPLMVPLNLTDDPTFSELAFGLQFSVADGSSWNVSEPNSPDANFDGGWDFNQTSQSDVTFSLNYPDMRPLYTTFNLALQGNVVPEPTALLLLAGAPCLLGRYRRRA